MSGHTGCNGIGGNVSVKGRYLQFSRLMGTLMACDDGGFETRYKKLLSSKELKYEINEGMLTLSGGEQQLRFQKVD